MNSTDCEGESQSFDSAKMFSFVFAAFAFPFAFTLANLEKEKRRWDKCKHWMRNGMFAEINQINMPLTCSVLMNDVKE